MIAEAKNFSAFKGAITSTGYSGDTLIVECKLQHDQLVIRPPTWYNRWRQQTWLLVLLCITLIFPVFLLIEYCRRSRFDVVTISYPLKVFVPCEPGQTSTRSKAGRRGETAFSHHEEESAVPSYHMQGYQEGKWLREWEPAIRRCVMTKYRGRITGPDAVMDDPNMTDPRELLDGYTSDL